MTDRNTHNHTRRRAVAVTAYDVLYNSQYGEKLTAAVKKALEAPYLHWLGLMKELEKSAKLETRVKVTRVTEEGVFAVNQKGEERFYEADTILLAVGLKPRTELVESLRDSVPNFVVIGDCQRPATAMEAIHMGYFSAMNI